MVHLYFWEVKKSRIPNAIIRMATNHLLLKFNKSITFYKLLGTGRGATFTPGDANLRCWGLLAVSDNDLSENRVIRNWQRIATHEKYFKLSPLSSHGTWARKNPFKVSPIEKSDSEIAAITRARIKFKLSNIFWRSVPPVVSDLKNSEGLISAIGIGEAPIGLQGTFSIWRNQSDLAKFAFQGAPHAEVIKKTRNLGWYSEELFARFEVLAKAE